MSADAGGSEMSTSMNSDASYDIDIVRHHDGNNDIIIDIDANDSKTKYVPVSVATSTANLLDASDSDSETETESEEEQSRYGKSKSVSFNKITHFNFVEEVKVNIIIITAQHHLNAVIVKC